MLLIFLTNCFSPDKMQKQPADKNLKTGTIVYNDLEGGFFGIISDDSTRYNPVNLPEAFKRDGIRIRFSGTPDHKAASVQMWGIIYRISEIEVIALPE
jgi:inhibitor of cysteine peptidase